MKRSYKIKSQGRKRATDYSQPEEILPAKAKGLTKQSPLLSKKSKEKVLELEGRVANYRLLTGQVRICQVEKVDPESLHATIRVFGEKSDEELNPYEFMGKVLENVPYSFKGLKGHWTKRESFRDA